MSQTQHTKPALRSLNLLAGAFLAVLILFLAGFLRYAWIVERNHKVHELSGVLRFCVEFTENYFERITATHRKISTELLQTRESDIVEKASTMFSNYKKINLDQLRFTLLSENGEVIADTEKSGNRPDSLSFSDIPLRKFEPDGHYLEKLEFDASHFKEESGMPDGNLTIPLRYAIRSQDGNLKYLVRSRLRVGLLQNFWKTTLIPQESILGFMNDQGNLVTIYSANPSTNPSDSFGTQSTQALANHLQKYGFPISGYAEITNTDNDPDQITVYQRLNHYPVTFFASVPKSYIWTGWWKRVRMPAFLWLTLILAGGTGYVLAIRNINEKNALVREQTQLHDVAQGALIIQEQERARISHELHDEVGQALTALALTLNSVQQSSGTTSAIEAPLFNCRMIVEKIMADVRTIAYRLRPAELDQLGLTESLRAHLEKSVLPLMQNVIFKENIGNARFSRDLELCCFRVVQEAVTNCMRHANASEIRVEVNHDISGKKLDISIIDNGTGFDINHYFSTQVRTKKLGLLGMRERVAANRGKLTIQSDGKGTEVAATFDLVGEN